MNTSTISFVLLVTSFCTVTMPGIMMNSYSSSSRKTIRRSCCIRSRTASSTSCGSTSSSYFSSHNNSSASEEPTSSSTSPSRTNSIDMRNGGYDSGTSSPKLAGSTRSLDTYFAKTNKEQRKSDEWGHFVDI